eukprot:m.419396 g.419396  ORF g.419396 m.419396 type:complete len:98 (-) comp31500_c0_seq1:91-384(-)
MHSLMTQYNLIAEEIKSTTWHRSTGFRHGERASCRLIDSLRKKERARVRGDREMSVDSSVGWVSLVVCAWVGLVVLGLSLSTKDVAAGLCSRTTELR